MGWRRTSVVPLVLLATAIVAPATPFAEPRSVEVLAEARVYGLGRTPEEARREALQRAREDAVSQVTGIVVSAQQLRLRSEADREPRDAFSSLIRTSTSGRIVREEVVYRTTVEDDVPVYHAMLRAEVVVEEGARDPGFTLELETRPAGGTIRDGEELSLEIVASRDCYLTVLNVLSDGTLAHLFPNDHASNNRVEAGRKVRLPADGHPFRIRAVLPPGRSRDHEQILAVATLDPVPLILEETEGLQEAVTSLNRWLLGIPLARRAEALWSFEIVP